MEATIPSSFSNTWRWMYTHTNSPGFQNRIAKKGHRQIPHLVPETLTRSPRQTYGDNTRSLCFLPTAMTNRWHFNFNCNDQQMAFWQDRDSARESRTKRHRKHLFVTWSTHTTDGFWHIFGSMGFLQLDEEKFVNYFSSGLSSSQDEAKESE